MTTLIAPPPVHVSYNPISDLWSWHCDVGPCHDCGFRFVTEEFAQQAWTRHALTEGVQP